MPRRKRAFGRLSITDAELLAAALFGLEHRRTEIEEKMVELRRQIGGRGSQRSPQIAAAELALESERKRPRLSVAARRRIAEAQKKRWAAARKAKSTEATPKTESSPGKRKLSAAGRKRIIEATKKRWAEYNAKKAAMAK